MSYVKLEGLGKIPFSNIRRPKPLMDVDPTPPPAKPDQGQCAVSFPVVLGLHCVLYCLAQLLLFLEVSQMTC